MKARVILSTAIVIVIAMCLPLISHAQIDPPADPVDTPIDGGLSILLAAGVGYGVKKVRDSRKKAMRKNDEQID